MKKQRISKVQVILNNGNMYELDSAAIQQYFNEDAPTHAKNLAGMIFNRQEDTVGVLTVSPVKGSPGATPAELYCKPKSVCEVLIEYTEEDIDFRTERMKDRI